MFNLKQDDMISKTDMLLFDILEELRQLNKSLRLIAKGAGVKKKAKPKTVKPKQSVVKTESLEVQDGNNTDH